MRTNLLKDIFEFFSDGSLTEFEKKTCLCPAILVPFFCGQTLWYIHTGIT